MPIKGQSPKEIVHTEMHKFKHKNLHSGSKHGPLVKSRKQAIAIALSESGQSRALRTAKHQAKKYADGGKVKKEKYADFRRSPNIEDRRDESDDSKLNGMFQAITADPASWPPQTIPPRNSLSDQLGTKTLDKDNHFASGGMSGGFNPERGAAFGLARQGMIKSEVPGRTDKLSLNVPTGSYIIPADIPSALGQGNSMAGSAILNKIFNSGPYGMNLPRAKGGSRVGSRHSSLSSMHMAKGGKAVAPIVAAGGEHILHPDAVARLGHGDINLGHEILDAFVEHVRKENIKTLSQLKPPKGSKNAKRK